MAEILEELFHNKYSESTMSRITDIAVPEISKRTSKSIGEEGHRHILGRNVLLHQE
jgi:hypothetical protein